MNCGRTTGAGELRVAVDGEQVWARTGLALGPGSRPVRLRLGLQAKDGGVGGVLLFRPRTVTWHLVPPAASCSVSEDGNHESGPVLSAPARCLRVKGRHSPIKELV